MTEARTIVVDVGATHTRVAQRVGGSLGPVEVLDDARYASFGALLDDWLDRHPEATGAPAVIAVAGPVDGDVVHLTNRGWTVAATGLPRLGPVRLLNDLAAAALAVPGLGVDEVVTLGGPAGSPAGTRLVIGVGTGLGLAALVPDGQGWRALATEGGHVALAGGDAREQAVLGVIGGSGRVSAETVLSGPGLRRLYEAVRAADGQSPTAPPSEAITAAALAHTDPTAVETLVLFARLLGRFAGDAALLHGARGGVGLVGSLPRTLEPVLAGGAFRDGFDDKGVMAPYVATIPTWLACADELGLRGAATLADAA